VVVAMPVALRVAHRTGMAASSLAVAVALTANATSFLLPTSNLTSLLVLSRSPMSPSTFLEDSWVAWLLVTVLTIAALAAVAGRRREDASPDAGERGASRMPVLVDLIPMFVAASAIRALLGTALVLTGGPIQQIAAGSLLAAGVNNLPAAAAVHAVGATGHWIAVLAMALGPNLLLTGSVASLICRQMAHEGQARFGVGTFTMLGTALLPIQLLVAFAGLMLTGAVR
jgi:Na+/H+ antiporter NhaD/arsenite permease-like protein